MWSTVAFVVLVMVGTAWIVCLTPSFPLQLVAGWALTMSVFRALHAKLPHPWKTLLVTLAALSCARAALGVVREGFAVDWGVEGWKRMRCESDSGPTRLTVDEWHRLSEQARNANDTTEWAGEERPACAADDCELWNDPQLAVTQRMELILNKARADITDLEQYLRVDAPDKRERA